MELVDTLVKNLGIGQGQAEGGAGLIFNMVKGELGAGDFSQLTGKIPEIGSLIKAASAETSGEGLMGMVGNLASSAGGDSQLGQMGKLAQLAGAFEKLGLKPDMVSKFIPIIMAFVQKKGGDSLAGMLQSVLKV